MTSPYQNTPSQKTFNMNYLRFLRGAYCIPLLGGLVACNVTTELYEVTLEGSIQNDGSPSVPGAVTVALFHASSGEGDLAHPLELIERFELDGPGDFSHVFLYPLEVGEGLVVYAWQDLDGDGILCAPGQTLEVAGLVEVNPFPAHSVLISLSLGSPCAGPESLYPPGATAF